MRWLRLHLSNDHKVDLAVDQSMSDRKTLSRARAATVFGTHPGGQCVAIPRDSILWAEIIVVLEEDDQPSLDLQGQS